MTKFKVVVVLLFISLAANAFFLLNTANLDYRRALSGFSGTGVIHQEECPDTVLRNRICRIEVLEKRGDIAMLRIHYHYRKGHEHSNRIVVKANKGSHDNIVGTKAAFHIVEGDNTIDIPFGMYRAGAFTKNEPYRSKYIMVRAQGLTEDSRNYTSPHLLELYAQYDQPWYMDGEDSSW